MRQIIVMLCALMCATCIFADDKTCTPPVNTTVNQQLVEAVRTLACSAQDSGGSLDAVVDDIPFGAKFSTGQKNCSSLEQSRSQASSVVTQYLSTPDSLMVAECGFRACQLVTAGASTAVLESFYAVCNGAGRPAKYPTFVLQNKYIQITTPLTNDPGVSDNTLIVNNNSELNFSATGVEAFSDGIAMTLRVSKQQIVPGLNKIPIRVTYPKVRQEPSMNVDFKLTVDNNKATVDGTLLLTKDIHCGKQCKQCDVVNNRGICRRCELSVSDLDLNGADHYTLASPGGTALFLECGNMQPKQQYTISVSGDVWPDYRTINNAVCGTNQPNNQIDWIATVNSNITDVTQHTISFPATHILTPTMRVDMQGSGTVPDNGTVSAYISAPVVDCWPDTKGPLGLANYFKLSIDAPLATAAAMRVQPPKTFDHLRCSKGSKAECDAKR